MHSFGPRRLSPKSKNGEIIEENKDLPIDSHGNGLVWTGHQEGRETNTCGDRINKVPCAGEVDGCWVFAFQFDVELDLVRTENLQNCMDRGLTVNLQLCGDFHTQFYPLWKNIFCYREVLLVNCNQVCYFTSCKSRSPVCNPDQ